MPNTPEERTIEKIRKVLIADSTITNYTSQRVYASHISSIEAPVYPAISIHLLLSRSIFECPGMIGMSLQIDCWFPAKDYSIADILTVTRKLRDLLHRQNLIDTDIGIKVAQCIEVQTGPLLREEETELLHYPVQYSVTAA